MNNQANLTNEDRQELNLLLKSSPSLKIAHELKEELIAIYNSAISPSGRMRKIKEWLISARVMFPSAADYNSDLTASGGMRKMKKWLISARVMFGSAADTLESHLEEICNYFTNRTTSGARSSGLPT